LPDIAPVVPLSVSVAVAEPDTPPPSVKFPKLTPPFVETCHWNVGAGLPFAAAANIALPPAVTVWLPGCVVMAGAVFTVNVTAELVVVLTELITSTRYSLPVIDPVVPLSVSVAVAEPDTPPPSVMFPKFTPPFVETCHWSAGAGCPLAAAVKVAVFPAVTVWLTGCVVIAGAVFTVSVAAVLVAVPSVLIASARYWLPDIAPVVPLTVKVAVAEPDTPLPSVKFPKLVPPFVETCHWNAGAGLPLAATVNVAAVPAVTVWFTGGVAITGAAGAALTVSVAAVLVAVPAALIASI
jgi:hypothetical protein